MNRLSILYTAVEKQNSIKLSKLDWIGRRDHHELNRRIDKLCALACFLSLRGKIKSIVRENYSNPEFNSYIATDLITEGIEEFENFYYLDTDHLYDLNFSYAESCFAEINNKTLKLL